MKITTLNNSAVIQSSLESGTFQWILKPYAHANIIHIVENDCVAKLEFLLEQSSILQYHPIIIGGVCNELNLTFHVKKSAHVIVNGAYALNNQQRATLITHQNHEQSGSYSALAINGVAADDAKISYHGSIAIQKDASRSNAMQENKTLLLGSRAQAISIPSLEVKNNDVQCAHGSAVGPLAEDQLLYAQSRGISRTNARRLLLSSFFAQTLEGMLDKNLQEELVERLVVKILGEKSEV